MLLKCLFLSLFLLLELLQDSKSAVARLSLESNRGTERRHIEQCAHSLNLTSPPTPDHSNYRLPKRARRYNGLSTHSTEQSEAHVHLADCRHEYEYERLEPGSIRLLYMLPGPDDQEIHCRFESVSLSDPGPYEALSYVWGSDPATNRINVDGKAFYVKSNLYHALGRLRSPVQVVRLWIDALCIDQSSVPEKSAQIQHMKQIYENAARCLVWLGENDADMQHALRFVSRILNPETLKDENWLSDYGIVSLAKLMNAEWWKRAWIVQEVAVVKDRVFLCGDQEIHFSDIADAIDIVRSRLADIRVSFKTSPYYQVYDGLLEDLNDSHSVRLLDTLKDLFLRSADGAILGSRCKLGCLLHKFRDYQTTDRRDRVWSLLSLCSDRFNKDLCEKVKVDYSLSLLEVYSSTYQYLSSCSSTFDIFMRPWLDAKRTPWTDDVVDPDLRFHVPSWLSVLDDLPFGNPKHKGKRRMNADRLIGQDCKLVYNAHDNSPAKIRFGFDDLHRKFNGTLFARGVVLGDVSSRSDRMAEGIITEKCLDMIGGILRGDNGTIIDISDQLLRTLCANRGRNGERLPSLYRTSLLQILRHCSDTKSIDTEEMKEEFQTRTYVRDLLERMQAVVWDRRVIHCRQVMSANIASTSLVGLGPRSARLGDKICVLYGCSVPVILRPHQSTRDNQSKVLWELVGEAYVDGKMDGEALYGLTDEQIRSIEGEFEIR